MIKRISKLSYEARDVLIEFAKLYIDEIKDIALNGNIKDEKIQEEIIARQYFNDWFDSLMKEVVEYEENRKDN